MSDQSRAHAAATYLLRATLADPLTRVGYDVGHGARFTAGGPAHYKTLADPGAAIGDLAAIAGTLSTGERLLYHLALDLWNGSGQAEVGELIRTLDDETYTAAMHAVRIRRPPLRGLRDLADDADADLNREPPRRPSVDYDPPGREEL